MAQEKTNIFTEQTNRKCQDYSLYKMRVLKYYVEIKAQLETWK